MTRETLLVEFAPNLAFCFDQFPDSLTAPINDVFGAFVVDATRAKPLTLSGNNESSIAIGAHAKLITERDGIRVCQEDSVVHFKAPGIRAWCDAETESAGLESVDAAPGVARNFTAIALMSIVLELALTRGWLGLHAAAVAIDGNCVLLPGDSGVGKSTIYRNAAAAGLDTLSSDLVWLREAPGHIEVRPLPRGSIDTDAPMPSVEKAILKTIVCPSIVDSDDNRLEHISVADLLQTIVRQSGFLSPALHARRFAMLTRVAGSVPSYRLAAGRNQQAVPAMLRSLLV